MMNLDGLVTNQNVTAPKLYLAQTSSALSLVTNQNVTAPKLLETKKQ